jgi:hypothetical protein
MAFLEVIDGDHQRQPGFARWGFRRSTFVLSSRQVLLLEPVNPLPNRGTRDMEEAAHTHLGPPLTIEGDHLRAGLGTGRVAVVVEPRERGR